MKFISVLFFMISLGALAMDDQNSVIKKFAQAIELDEANCSNLIQAVDHIFSEDKQAFLALLEKIGESGVPEQIIELAQQRVHNRTISDPNAMLSLGGALLCIKCAINIYHEHKLGPLNLTRIKRGKLL